jgi:uncharacterized Tic20 family protein
MTENPPPPAPAAAPLSEKDERLYATIAHAGVITGFLLPLIMWLIGKDRSSFVDEEAKKALNFGIIISIAYVLSAIPVIGWILWIAAIIASLVFGIQGAMKANVREPYTYPFNLNLVK